jgi:adenosylcobinamide-GDP ribazoletransferase
MRAAELRGAAAAVAFLTRIPVGRLVALDAADVARGGAFFPLVGAGVGAVVGGIAQAAAGTLTGLLAATLAVAAGAALTGALHLDALADAADALGSARDRALEIMRDHAIGAYGTAALVLDLGAKVGALSALAASHDALRIAVCAAASARAAPVALSAALPYARPGAGLGRALDSAGLVRLLVAVAIAVVACVALHAAVVLGSTAVVTIACGLGARRWLGGVTGDVLGATTELAELAGLVVGVAIA